MNISRVVTYPRFLKTWILLSFFFLLVCLEATAFELTPLSVTVEPHGKQSSTFIKVTNKHSFPKAIQITMETRDPDLYDKEDNNQDAEDDFLVYPPQFILEAESTKVCKISWIGNPSPTKELSFRFIVDELDVNLQDEEVTQSGIKLLMRYEGALYVKPQGLKGGDIKVMEEEIVSDEEGKHIATITLHNAGDTHQIIKNSELIVTSVDDPTKSVTLGPKELKGLEGSNILAGKTRKYQVELPKEFNVVNAKVNFNLVD